MKMLWGAGILLAIADAVSESIEQDLGALSEEPSTPERTPAHYRGFESMVDLLGAWYLALVVPSDAWDEFRTKRFEGILELEGTSQVAHKIEYAWHPRGRFFELHAEVEEKPLYASGRPKADGTVP